VDGERNGPEIPILQDEVPEVAARQELDRILADPEFHCTQRNRRFLRFVAEEYFRGRGQAIKAYTIAVDVFGRASSFDPSTDPIVRIEATRLRIALTRYYELYGRDRPVRISLPKGHYVPVFSRAPDPAQEEPQSRAEPPERLPSPELPSFEPYPDGRPRWFSGVLGIACAALLGGLLLATDLVRYGDARLISDKPNLTIEMRIAGNVADDEAMAVRDALIVALSGFRTLRISAPDAVTAGTDMGRGSSGQPWGAQRRYRLLLKYGADRAGARLWWQVIDETSGEALRSATEPIDSRQAEHSVQRIASQLAVRLASNRGIISTAETARELDKPTLGNGCILRSMLAIESGDKEALGEGRRCLETTLTFRRNDADIYAMLAAVFLEMEAPDAHTVLTDAAVRSAGRAVALAPDSYRSFYAQMITQFSIGNPDSAIVAGRRALELNPYDPMAAAELAKILFVTGRWDEGAALARTTQREGILPAGAAAVLAFDAYRRGEFDEALLRLNQMSDRNCYRLQLLKVATLGQLSRIDEANEAAADLRRSHPQFEESFRAELKHRQFAPSLIALIEAGLQRAGLKVA
jgi:tetratricopeptide (TPR) repeat protein